MDNYCYALQKYLCETGYDAYIIRYNCSNDYQSPLFRKILMAFNLFILWNYFSYRIRKKKTINEKEKSPRFFNKFKEKYIKFSKEIYYTYKELYDNPPEADIYIVGSERVLNFYHSPDYSVKNWIQAYFLNFGSEKTRRIAYAASFGTNLIRKNI